MVMVRVMIRVTAMTKDTIIKCFFRRGLSSDVGRSRTRWPPMRTIRRPESAGRECLLGRRVANLVAS